MIRMVPAAVLVILASVATSFGAHPLITDDAGTQGRGRVQVEVNSEFSFDKEADAGLTTRVAGGEVSTILSYGITDNLDLILGVPYQWFKIEEDDSVISQEDGISDMSFEIKWRLFENGGYSLALKPNVSLPAGDENKGLGNGRLSYGVVIITSREIEPWAFHLNVSYTHNEYKRSEDRDANRKGIWHVSFASEYEAVEDLRLVANTGMERNPDKSDNTHPAFILGGLIYSLSEQFDINAGVKGGLNKPETDLAVLAGIVWRF